jgi:hypothetical protein
MRSSFSDLRRSGLVALAVGMTFSSAQAFEVSAAEERACEPDAFRLCSSAIPDVDRVAACMEANETSLAPQCKALFHERSSERKGLTSMHKHVVRRILSDYAGD